MLSKFKGIIFRTIKYLLVQFTLKHFIFVDGYETARIFKNLGLIFAILEEAPQIYKHSLKKELYFFKTFVHLKFI